MSHLQLATLKTCTGCLACVDICPQQALTPYREKDGFVYVACDENKCVLCHKCERICPVANGMKYSSNTLTKSIPYSIYSTDKKSYDRATSGGAFIAIALNFIKSGGYVCGSVFTEDGEVRHIISNNIADIILMQGSKYIQSNTNGIYKRIKILLDKGNKVLFFGMGCQAAAILSYFHNNKSKEKLYVIDIICGGVPTILLAETFLKNEPEYTKIAGFRLKEEYILSCYTQNNKIVFLREKRTLPLYGFYSDLAKRYSCGNCKFCGIERLSDITIGDYWGGRGKDGIHKSVAVAHSEKGKEMLTNLEDVVINRIDWTFLRKNFRYAIGKNYNNSRIQRKMLPWLFNHLSYRALCGIYGCNLNNPFYLAVTAYNHFIAQMQRLYINHILNKIMKGIQ